MAAQSLLAIKSSGVDFDKEEEDNEDKADEEAFEEEEEEAINAAVRYSNPAALEDLSAILKRPLSSEKFSLLKSNPCSTTALS